MCSRFWFFDNFSNNVRLINFLLVLFFFHLYVFLRAYFRILHRKLFANIVPKIFVVDILLVIYMIPKVVKSSLRRVYHSPGDNFFNFLSAKSFLRRRRMAKVHGWCIENWPFVEQILQIIFVFWHFVWIN